MKPYIFAVLAIYYALHQDFWNWSSAHPMLFGFFPIGLLYHALYAAGAALLMLLVVRKAWPKRLEEWADEETSR